MASWNDVLVQAHVRKAGLDSSTASANADLPAVGRPETKTISADRCVNMAWCLMVSQMQGVLLFAVQHFSFWIARRVSVWARQPITFS